MEPGPGVNAIGSKYGVSVTGFPPGSTLGQESTLLGVSMECLWQDFLQGVHWARSQRYWE